MIARLITPAADWPVVHPRPPLHPLPTVIVLVTLASAIGCALYRVLCGIPDALRCYPA